MEAFRSSDDAGMQVLVTLNAKTQKRFLQFLGKEAEEFERLPHLEKAGALESYLKHRVELKLNRDFEDAKKQQSNQFDDLNFANASHTGNVSLSKEEPILKDAVGSNLPHISKRSVGIAWMQGRRNEMEDEHLVTEIAFKSGNSIVNAEVYAIFDGHSGEVTAKYLKASFPGDLKLSLEKFNADAISDLSMIAGIKDAFENLDNYYKGGAGSTVIAAIIVNNCIYAACLGDSRAVLKNGDTTIQLSEDQKCSNPKYAKGVTKLGGFIFNNRVNGQLAVPRAIGDHNIRGTNGKCISPIPIVMKFDMAEVKSGSALILACDGLWDVCTSNQAGDFVGKIPEGSPDTIPEQLIVKAYNAISRDNITAMIVKMHS